MQCPRCHADLHVVLVRNSRSRVDNTTYICSDCGMAEAVFNHFWPDKPLPPLDQEIELAVGNTKVART
jgi:hypothetical protein